MIIVLDTNVLVSGILRPLGNPGTILRQAAAGLLRLAYDPRILAEYREVLSRPIFGLPPDAVETLLGQLEVEGVSIVAAPLPVVLPDASDSPFLEVAAAGHVEALVTGNIKHFHEGERIVRILSPAEFLLGLGGHRSPRKAGKGWPPRKQDSQRKS